MSEINNINENIREANSLVRMKEKHLPYVCKIEEESFSEKWSEAALKNAIGNDNFRFYCLIDDFDKVSGYVGIAEACGEGEIVRVAVEKSFRKQGLGNYLLNEVILEEKKIGTKKLFLEVRESNQAAIRLYEKKGFVIDGRRKNFYRKPTEDALLMSRPI